MQLRMLGYEPVGHAMRGEQAVDLACELVPDLVLMDIQLAGVMDGIAAAQAIRLQLGIPVVFLTAFAADDVLARAHATQPFGYLLKPFSERELRVALEMAFFRSDAVAKLRASEMQFRAIFEAEPECVKVVSPDGILLQMNAAGLSMLEAESVEAVSAKPLLEYIDAQYRAAFLDLHHRVFEGQSGTLEFEIEGLRGGRRMLESHAVPMRDETGTVTKMLAISRDVTQKKLAMRERRLSEHIFSTVSQGVLVTSPDQKIVSANKAFLAITGFSRHELIGKTCILIQGPLTDARTVKHIRDAVYQGIDFEGEILNYRKDGSCFWNELSISPVRDESGTVTHLIGITRDITERKKNAQAQQEQLMQLQSLSRRVLEAQETERRRVAHELHDELGQSLTAIKINLQANDRPNQAPSPELNAENIRIVESTLAQVRSLALALRPSMLDDLGLVPALRWMVDQNAVRGHIHIDLQCALPSARLSTEIETACFRITQEALTNILRHADCTHVDIQLLEVDGTVVLNISDNGRGFDVAAKAQQSRSGYSMGVQGMQERAVLVGGTLEVESEPGRGSTLHMQCPLRLKGAQP